MNIITESASILLLILVISVFRKQKLHFDREKCVNALVSVGITFFMMSLMAFSFVAGIAPEMKNVYNSLGIPRVDPAFWSNVHPALIVLIGLLAKDFADYWNHRAMHLRMIWPIHAIHHSDEHVNAFTTYRVHILEVLFMNASYLVLISWLGLPPVESAVIGIILLLHNAYVHMELDWDHGPLRALIASPRFHRWHHADLPEAYGKNLANIFPFYDIAFGTYYVPGACNAPLGARDTGVKSADLPRLVLFPFTAWAGMIWTTARSFIAKRDLGHAASSSRTSPGHGFGGTGAAGVGSSQMPSPARSSGSLP